MVKYYTYLEIFLDDLHKKVTLGDFERYFSVSHQTMKARLKPFVSARILAQDQRPRFVMYSLNLSNPLTREYLVMCEKERLMDLLNKPLFRRFYENISGSFMNSRIMIFGSAVSKEHFADIDVLIVRDESRARKDIETFSKTYDVKTHVMETDEKGLSGAFLSELRKSHIIFNGHDFFVWVLYRHELGLVQEKGDEVDRT